MREGHLLLKTEAQDLTLSTSPIRQAFEDFLLSREAMRCTPATLEHYRYSAGVFITWLELRSVTHPEEVTAAHVREWLAGMPKAKDTTLRADHASLLVGRKIPDRSRYFSDAKARKETASLSHPGAIPKSLESRTHGSG
jgi:hypothetical protein